MPELPEVDALAGFLRERTVGMCIARIDLASFSILKTYDPPLTVLDGRTITGVERHGKFIDVAALGPDALSDGFEVAAIIGRRMQLKRLLRDQKIVAGIGNAYSDEILHAAGLSPFAIAENLDAEEIHRLENAIRRVLAEALAAARGKPANDLKDDKRIRMHVHGRAGQKCAACGDTIREVTFSNSSLQYCPGCQTAGKPLKDRTTSKFLK